MHAFCINLDRSPDRLAYMRAEARKIGLALERVCAVDGADVPAWLDDQFASSDLLPGEIGCYASHLLAARMVVERALPFAIVTEDDVPLAIDFVPVVRAAIAAAPTGWDFIHLTEYNLRTLVELADLPGGHSLVRYTRLPKNTVAYVISNAGARKWLSPAARTRPCDVDVRYAWQFDFNVVGVYPPVAFRSARFASDIDATTIARRRTPKRRWAPSLASRLYGAVWQTRQIGIVPMLLGQAINAVDALVRRVVASHLPPVILPPVILPPVILPRPARALSTGDALPDRSVLKHA